MTVVISEIYRGPFTFRTWWLISVATDFRAIGICFAIGGFLACLKLIIPGLTYDLVILKSSAVGTWIRFLHLKLLVNQWQFCLIYEDTDKFYKWNLPNYLKLPSMDAFTCLNVQAWSELSLFCRIVTPEASKLYWPRTTFCLNHS